MNGSLLSSLSSQQSVELLTGEILGRMPQDAGLESRDLPGLEMRPIPGHAACRADGSGVCCLCLIFHPSDLEHCFDSPTTGTTQVLWLMIHGDSLSRFKRVEEKPRQSWWVQRNLLPCGSGLRLPRDSVALAASLRTSVPLSADTRVNDHV